MLNFLSPAEMFAQSMFIAAESHMFQVDKNGMPYILHPLTVAITVASDDLEVRAGAVLHDVIEDSKRHTLEKLLDRGFTENGLMHEVIKRNKKYTIESLRELGYSERVLTILTILTHDKSESYDDYITRICTNYDCILIKMADITHNTAVYRQKGETADDHARLIKYFKAYKRLEAAKAAFESCIIH